jgi:MFS family permease
MTIPPVATSSTGRVVLRISPFIFIIFCAYLTIGLPLAALPLQIHDILGWNTFVVGIVIGIQPLATLVTRPIAGTLCDRRGARFVVRSGGIISTVGGAIYLLAVSLPVGAYATLSILVVGRVVSGLAESLLITGNLAWAIGVVGPKNTGKVMVWVGIGMYAAIAVGAPIGIELMTHAAASGGFVAASLGTIVFALLATIPAAVMRPVAPHGGPRMPFFQVAWRIAPFGTGLALATLGFAAIGTFAALDFQTKGWPGASFALSGFGIAYIATRLIFGGWPDRFGGARVATWSLLIEGCGQILLWLAPHPAVAFVGAILAGAGFSLVFPSLGIEAVKQVPAASRGAALGAYVAFFDIGFGLAGPITGIVAGALGYPSVFACGALAVVAAIVATRRVPRRVHDAPDVSLA